MNKETSKVRLTAEAVDSSHIKYIFKVDVYLFEDDGTMIAYCPCFDLTSYGDDFNMALSNFYECMQLHVECCVEKGTLFDDLKAHGWSIEKKKLAPPKPSYLIQLPSMMRLLDDNIYFNRVVAPVPIPACV